MTESTGKRAIGFWEELQEQRWDDHRYYHQSRINQTLHLFSACCFVGVYVLLFVHPPLAAIIGWIVPMWVRQLGHFFFEPRSFDTVNKVTHDQKEAIKVGFNLERKLWLLAAWAAVPVVLWLVPAPFGLPHHGGFVGWWHRVGWAWLALAAAGLLARTLYLIVRRGPQTGLVWFTKILTDPWNDIRTYWRSPMHLLKGELLDPMEHVGTHTF